MGRTLPARVLDAFECTPGIPEGRVQSCGFGLLTLASWAVNGLLCPGRRAVPYDRLRRWWQLSITTRRQSIMRTMGEPCHGLGATQGHEGLGVGGNATRHGRGHPIAIRQRRL